ncbi:MAG: Uncharacterised protein [Methanobacteriota archaeon]|nr:MAG: Uncharacterised protein [Euryarchaeota archaeon]
MNITSLSSDEFEVILQADHGQQGSYEVTITATNNFVDGIANPIATTKVTLMIVSLFSNDLDEDGVIDSIDACPNSSFGVEVDATGCTVAPDIERSSSFLDSLISGDTDTVTQTVGFGAILLAFLALLQTNAVAALLPDTFRWVQVLRKKSKLSKEEINELTYLQSLVQAFFTDQTTLKEELRDMKADLTARYTNNEIKKDTREKLFTIIDDLLSTSAEELEHIAHNEIYFGLAETLDTNERTALLNEKVSMEQSDPPLFEEDSLVDEDTPNEEVIGTVSTDGYEYLEFPVGSGKWFIRNPESGLWEQWSKYNN